MKILVALNNEIIKQKLDEMYNEEVYKYDIDYMEGVIEFLGKTDEEYILITKDTLNGSLNNKLYIKQIRFANPKTKIIYVVNNLDSEYKEFLFANEVFNILEGDNINIDVLKENIEENKAIVYKVIENKNISSVKEPAIDYRIENQVLPKELIAVYGTSGSGKSLVSGIIAKDLCKKLNISVALLDMDIQNPSIDILNNLETRSDLLSKVVEEVDKVQDINGIIDKYMIKDKNNKNLWYMTNNTSIFDCQNKLSNRYYEQIYNSINLKYDYTLIDLPSSPFLDVVQYTLAKATKVFFVVNPNYISIRQAIKYLDLLTKLWDVSINRIYIVINKIQKSSLDDFQIQSMLNGYKIVGNINYNKNMDAYINGAISDIEIDYNLNGLYSLLKIKANDIIKPKIFSGIWRKNNDN